MLFLIAFDCKTRVFFFIYESDLGDSFSLWVPLLSVKLSMSYSL